MIAKFSSLSGRTKESVLVLAVATCMLVMGLILLAKGDGFGLNIGTGVYTLLVGMVVWRVSDLWGRVREELRRQQGTGAGGSGTP